MPALIGRLREHFCVSSSICRQATHVCGWNNYLYEVATYIIRREQGQEKQRVVVEDSCGLVTASGGGCNWEAQALRAHFSSLKTRINPSFKEEIPALNSTLWYQTHTHKIWFQGILRTNSKVDFGGTKQGEIRNKAVNHLSINIITFFFSSVICTKLHIEKYIKKFPFLRFFYWYLQLIVNLI